ncbi:MAG: hypothetical protein JW861_12735 [Bacteroidales bacterium]|nr:hypothetical protein [Bacteroidales bacterium]
MNSTRSQILLWSFLCILLLYGAVSCTKDDKDSVPPAIILKTGGYYAPDGDTVEVGGAIIFGIEAWGSDVNITNFTIKKLLPDKSHVTMMDTGMNTASMNIEKVFHQSVEDTAIWSFTVMDRNRLSSSVSLTIYKDPNSAFGGIHFYPSLIMGYQENAEYGHFLNPFTGKVFFQDSASLAPENMHILCYYIESEGLPSPVLSSPGEMDNYSIEAQTFYPVIEGWSPRRYTKWDISVDEDPVAVDDYNNAFNDSLLIVSYHDVWGKKKFKWANAGRVIPFLTATGKYGLIRVIRADHAPGGIMEISVKIQQ